MQQADEKQGTGGGRLDYPPCGFCLAAWTPLDAARGGHVCKKQVEWLRSIVKVQADLLEKLKAKVANLPRADRLVWAVGRLRDEVGKYEKKAGVDVDGGGGKGAAEEDGG